MNPVVPAIPSLSELTQRTLDTPAGVRHQRVLRIWFPLGFVLVLTGVSAVYNLYLLESSLGLSEVIIPTLFALLAVGIVVPVFLWIDRFEVEPGWLLWLAFLWGGLVANAGAAILNHAAHQRFDTGPELSPLVVNVIGPINEEVVKGAGLVLLLWFRRREIDGVLDGIVYGGLIGAGFAFVENIDYLAEAYFEGWEQLFLVAGLRELLGPFAHSMFTVCTGIGVGIAAVSTRRLIQVGAPLLGLAVGSLAHGLSNAFFLLVEFPLSLAFIGLLAWAMRREAQTVARELPAYVAAGWLTQPEALMLGSRQARRQTRAWAKRQGGKPAGRRMAELQEAAGGLAMVRAKMRRGIVDEALVQEERDLLMLLAERRQEFTDGSVGTPPGPAEPTSGVERESGALIRPE